MSRTIYVVKPPVTDELDVVHTYHRVYRAVPIASELWRLLGNEERAKAVLEASSSAFDHDPPTLEIEQLTRLLSLVDDLRPAVVGNLTDSENKLSLQRVVELRGQAETLDLDEGRGVDAQWAVAEALHDVDNLIAILKDALAEGHYLVYD